MPTLLQLSGDCQEPSLITLHGQLGHCLEGRAFVDSQVCVQDGYDLILTWELNTGLIPTSEHSSPLNIHTSY